MKKSFIGIWLSSIFIMMGMFQSSTAVGMIIARPVYHDSNTVIIVSNHQPSFEISLAENPTTGYRWNVPQYDSKLLTLVETRYIPSPSQLVGAGGFKRWTFEVIPSVLDANMPFESTITLTYARPWAKQDNPKTEVFTVMYLKKHEGTIEK